MKRSFLKSVILNPKSYPCDQGFTLVELIVAATVSTVVAGSAMYVLNDYHNSSIRSSNRRNLVTSSDNTLRIITNEVKQSEYLYPSINSISSSSSGLFGAGNACVNVIPKSEFLFALKLPNQVMAKGDYYKDLKKNDYKTRRIKNFIASDCNYVFYGIQKNNSSSNSQEGPYSLYRIGYDQTAEGYYNSNSVSKSILNSSISDSLNSPNGKPKLCDSNFYSIEKFGVQACIDSVSRRTLHLSLVSQSPNHGSVFFHTRSSSASSSISQGGTSSRIIPPPPDCNYSVVLLDISGSMNANMKFRNPPKKRIELARTEIINYLKACRDNSLINVFTFNGGSRGSSFKPNFVALNDSVREEIRIWLNKPAQRPGGGTYPWLQMEKAFRNTLVKQTHVISDGVTRKRGCFQGTCGDAALIFKARNNSRDPESLVVSSYSLDEDFCTGNNNYNKDPSYDARWMGRIASFCKVVQ